MYEVDTEDLELKKVGLELMFMTPEKYSHPDGITAVELAKLVELPLDVVKKKLTVLKDAGLVRVKDIISRGLTRMTKSIDCFVILMM